MINYDYIVKKRLGGEVKEYRPLLPKEMENVSKITGRNGSGKSTFLSLIALSCHGLSNENLIDALREDIKDLYEFDDCEFDFHITVGDNSGCELRMNSYRRGPMFSEDGIDRNIVIKELINGKESTLTQEQFVRKYRLIYDLPNDPIKRITGLVEAVGNAHKTYQVGIKDLAKETGSLIRNIGSLDPAKVEEDKKKLSRLKEEMENAERDCNNIERSVLKLQKYKAAIDIQDTKKRYELAKDNLKQAKKDSNLKDKTDRMKQKEYEQSEMEILVATNSFRQCLRSTSSLMRDTGDVHECDVEFWFKIMPDSTQIIQNEMLEIIYRQAAKIKKDLETKIRGQNTSKEEKTSRIIDRLLRIIEEYEKEDISILGDSISEFCSKLKEESEETNKKIGHTRSLKDLKEELENVIFSASKLEGKLKNRIPKPYFNEVEGETSIQDLVDEEELCKKKYDVAVGNAASFGVTLDNSYAISADMKIDDDVSDDTMAPTASLPGRIEELKKDLEKRNAEIKSNDGYIAKIARLEERIKSRESEILPPLFEYRGELEILEAALQKMQGGLDQKINLLKNIALDKAKASDIENEKFYYDLVCKYLADRLKHVSHAGEKYEVSSIDLFNKKMVMKDGTTEVPFKNMGTGESQNMYLRNQLENSDGRKVIALFDEVGLMDYKMIEDIHQKLKDMCSHGELLIGIMAAPGDKSGTG